MMAMVKKPVRPSQGAWRLFLALGQQFAERGRAGRQAEAEQVERGEGDHRAGENEGHEGERCHHGIGQQVAEHDGDVGDAEGAGGGDVFEIAAAQEFGAHDADQRHPGEEQQDAEQHPEAGGDDRGDDQQQIERGDRGPDLDEALEDQVDPAAEIALHGAGDDADDRGEDGQRQAEQHRDAEAVEQAGDDVAAAIVGAEPVDSCPSGSWGRPPAADSGRSSRPGSWSSWVRRRRNRAGSRRRCRS